MSDEEGDGSINVGSHADVARACLTLPPGRSLALEYLRQRGVCLRQGEQVARAVALRIEAEQRAGKRNVQALNDRIEQLERMTEILAHAARTAPWCSCRELADAVRAELNEYEIGTDGPIASALENLLDVGLEPSALQIGTRVKVKDCGDTLGPTGVIVSIDHSSFLMFQVQFADGSKQSYAAVSLEPKGDAPAP